MVMSPLKRAEEIGLKSSLYFIILLLMFFRQLLIRFSFGILSMEVDETEEDDVADCSCSRSSQ
jgi:hypothetical protein